MISKKITTVAAIVFTTTFLGLSFAQDIPEDAEIVLELREGPCNLIYEVMEGPDKGGFGVSGGGDVQVLRDTPKGLLEPVLPEGTRGDSILCLRSSPVPHPLDYRVILSGYEFRTMSMDNSRAFSTTLTKQDGIYLHTMGRGEMTIREREITDGILLQFLEDEKQFLNAE